MNTLSDALNQSFTADAARASALDPRRAISAIGRRRAVRTAGMGTAAAVGIGAVGAVWWLAPGGRSAQFAEPARATGCSDAQLYLPPNPEALGGVDVLFRAYVDLRPNAPHYGVVAVTPEGTVTRVNANADGDYEFNGTVILGRDSPAREREIPMVIDYDTDSGAGTKWDGITPVVTDYEWTLEVPTDVPDGVSAYVLSSMLRSLTGLGGLAYSESAVPDGTVTDALVTTTIGTTAYRLGDGDRLPDLAYSEIAVSVALQVSNLPGGETFTVTATHHDADPALTACASGSPSVSPSASPSASPSPTDTASPEPSSGPAESGGPWALVGPEAAVFACDAPLPAELEGTLGLDLSWQTGTVASPLPDMDPFEFGDGGLFVQGVQQPVLSASWPDMQPGWSASWVQADDGAYGTGLYVSLAAIRDGEIVGVVALDADDRYGFGPNDRSESIPNADGTDSVYAAVSSALSRLEPCEGHSDADLQGAQVVALLGSGLDADSHQFAWAPVDPS